MPVPLSPIYPFSEDGLQEIITQTVTKTPSYLLMACRSIMTKIAEDEVIEEQDDVIDRDVVQRYM